MRILFLFLFLSSTALAAKVEYVEGEVLIRYRDLATKTARSALLQSVGGKSIREIPARNTVLMKLPKGEAVSSAVQKIQLSPDVEFVQPNYIYRASATFPSDPLYPTLWGLKNTGQTILAGTLGPDSPGSTNNPGTSGRDMDLELAWDKIRLCNSVIVAVIDSGIHYTHEDLAANMWASGDVDIPHHGWNTLNDDDDPADDNGHGTHVAGTIGAVGNNAKGSTGVCWGVKLMAIKALGADGSGTTLAVAQGVTWAVDNNAKVINMSLGSGANDPTLEAALEYARTKDVVVVVAAGNDSSDNNSTPVYPCNYKKTNMICVAALTQSYALASFSNIGSNYVDVGAPGVNIVSPWPYTFAKTPDDFTTGWNNSGGSGTTDFGPRTVSGGYQAMAIPNNWTTWNNNNYYTNGAVVQTYKSFNLAGAATKVLLEYLVLNNLGTVAGDSLRAYYAVGAGDPIGVNLLDTYTGKTGGTAYGKSYDLTSDCSNATCSIGFQLTTDGSGVDTGALVLSFSLLKLTLADIGYNVIQGTSMASPHVAGLAAMVMAYQPGYSPLQVVEAVKNGGEAIAVLTSTTTTGKAVNAAGSLSYLTPPTSVVLTKE